MRAMWSSKRCCASAVITGPTSTDRRSGLPTTSSAIAPSSMGRTRSAISSCRQSTRSAEQRWPAESKAEVRASSTSCSGSAEESATSAFWPPVSAIRVGGLPSAQRRWASCLLIERATSVEPVNTTPATAALPTSRPPTAPSPGRSCSAARGTPASCRNATAWAAISGVSSAGLAITALPAASAPAIWPVKIDSGKFHGLMQATRPSGRCVSLEKPSMQPA